MTLKLHGSQRLDGSTAESWRRTTCGHCGDSITAAVLVVAGPGFDGSPAFFWMRCPSCFLGIIENGHGTVWPPALTIPRIDGLPPDAQAAFDEARRCFSVAAYAACELMCRKILMHVAVEKGATEGLTFAAYIEHLEGLGYVTPPMRPWVDLIRSNANAATHSLDRVSPERAESTAMFTAEFLRLVYEMGWHAARFVPVEEGQQSSPDA